MAHIKRRHMNLIVYLLIMLATLPVQANEWSGTVVGISDGDTLTVLNGQKRQVKIRMTEIDAPESKQAFGTQSKKSLSDLCFKKSVIVNDQGTDRYKRTLGRVKCDGIDANAEQVRHGMAWAYRQYLKDPAIAALEDVAKSARVGLWSEDNPTPPWEFRHGKKTAKQKPKADILASSGDSCGEKRTCKQMSSCSEANHYLNDCGLSRLDRDHDGVPCESLCR